MTARNLSQSRLGLALLRSREQGRIQGPPIFGKVNFIFLHCIQCLKKIFLKLNSDFIVAEIRGVFGSVGVYACVCE